MSIQIINQLESALGETVALLSSFNEEQINKIPFEGSWTAAQVGRHLYKSEADIDQLFYAPAQPAGRQPDERAEGLKQILLDYSTKMKSPDFIIPEDMEFDKARLITSLAEANDKMLKAVSGTDLTDIAPLEDGNPLQGSTKLEVVHFITYHTMRHNHQINKIKEIVQ
ncbi:DinB family protein [Flavobacterium subsaxonicum]|uniref:DinB-like domain-containing protein n=1 Tax=Flavobacterium subsaxonicum WB 4.1-42 = DSM 21790 TaxID=1121898 RepID=A0A0A2MRM3_9FLAO|nr:DinB family protein [Flavobacterium subsaxonicum]KGO94201.1 hypothetical protein Q766_04535 [Flavobacterium subsaxonicum WB 4.1-42 = DSM 21790]